MKKYFISESIAIILVLLILIGLPIAIKSYDRYIWEGATGDSVKVIKLYGRSQDGRWITERVTGWNYWMSDLITDDIEIDLIEGGSIRVAVTSTDVLHSFAFPRIREFRRPRDIYAGKWEVFDIIDPEDDEISFLCWQYCSAEHQHMKGNLLISYHESLALPNDLSASDKLLE